MRVLSLLFVFLMLSCEEPKPLVATTIDAVNILPIPSEIEGGEFGFLFDEETRIHVSDSTSLNALASELKQYLSATPFKLPIHSDERGASNVIKLDLVASDSIPNKEGYVLDIDSDRIAIVASDPQGMYRGLQSFKQLLPVEMLVSPATVDSLTLPGLKIVDQPAYPYRGMMLDVARHFFTVDQVKRLIDQMAFYKLNKLHLHLADDQGWRIEIKSWPKLTEIGGSTAVGGGKGGFYTQEQYADIVAYAAHKYITIIPEIDMPGHTNAALASYPELNCDGKAPKLYTGMRVGFSSLCVDKELTYTFIDDVIGEIAALTPGDYIHLGGDESHATPKKQYNQFLKRAFTIVEKHGKKVMGWEDIQSAGVSNSMILQYWTSEEVATKGLKQGAQVVLSPANRAYLDMKYTKDSKLGLNWAGYVEVDSAYIWEPKKLFGGKYSDQILGVESPLWSETITSSNDIEYLAFPRLIGHAELGWSTEQGDWDDYRTRLRKHYKVLEILNIDFYRSPIITGDVKQ